MTNSESVAVHGTGVVGEERGAGQSAAGGGSASLAVGLLFFAASLATYLFGAGRSYGYDESVTVGAFVDTPSLLDPFRSQIVFNNHPLFSFLEHVVWSGGGRSEVWLRLLPALFGAASVGLVAWWLARRWGALAGASAAGVLAANPLFAESARSVRGYSLLAFCGVVSTILALQMVEGGERRWWSIAYVVACAGGLAVHFYMAFVLAGQVAFVVARGALSERWRVRWYASAVLGAIAYLGFLDAMVQAARGRGRSFRPSFPVDAARDILGTHAIAVLVLAVLVAGAAWARGRRRDVALPALTVAALLVIVWVGLRPIDLYSRFLVWLVPGVAACAALAVVRWRPAVLAVGVAVIAMAAVQVRDRPEDDMALPRAASVVDLARSSGETPCAVGAEALLAYTRPPRDVTGGDGEGCDLIVLLASGAAFDGPGAAAAFPRVEKLGEGGVMVLRR